MKGSQTPLQVQEMEDWCAGQSSLPHNSLAPGEKWELEVWGQPRPKGSFYIRMFPTGPRGLMPPGALSWEALVNAEAKKAWSSPPLTSPVKLKCTFYSHPRSLRRLDVDKLLRAILDALTGVVYKDDALVYSIEAIKLEGTPHVHIQLSHYP